MSIDTENIKDEMQDFRIRCAKAKDLIKTTMQARYDRIDSAYDDVQWLQKIIAHAESGRNIDWLETELAWLEADGLETVPQHFVNHAISLAKQAIANQTPSLV